MVHEVFATVPGAAGSGYRDSQFPPPTHHYNKVEVTRSHLHPSYVPKNAIHQSNSLLIGWQGLCHNLCKLPVPTQAKSGTISTLVQLHELAPDHIICKSRGIIYRGHTFVEIWTFPFDFFCCGAINNRLFTLQAFSYQIFIQDKNSEMENRQMHKPLCAIKPLSAAAFHPAHTWNTLSGKLPISLLWQDSWPCAAEGEAPQ